MREPTRQPLAAGLTEVPPGSQRDPDFAAGQQSVAESIEELKAVTRSHDRAVVQRVING